MKFHSSSDFTHGIHSTSNVLSTSFTHENMTYTSKLSLLISSCTEPSQLPQAWPQLWVIAPASTIPTTFWISLWLKNFCKPLLNSLKLLCLNILSNTSLNIEAYKRPQIIILSISDHKQGCSCWRCGRLLSHKKNKIIPFAVIWVDLQIIILSEVRERQTSYDITYMWNLKKWYKGTYLKNVNRLTDFENKFMAAKGES